MNDRPRLILIMGLPATGKTTLSKKVAAEFNLPLISRDDLKTLIMDKVGWGDREWSKKVGQASYNLIYYYINEITRSKVSFIIESDFAPEPASTNFGAIVQSGYDIIQIICSATNDIIIDRWQERAANDKSHPSNTEGEQGLADLRAMIAQGPRQPLDIPSTIIQIDTSTNDNTVASKIINQLKELIS